jgi:hypothetical protein
MHYGAQALGRIGSEHLTDNGKREMAKDQILQIRLSALDRERVRKAAKEEFLNASTWARKVILEALQVRESKRA